MLVFITGGSGSGKSEFAEQQCLKLPETNRVYVATMENKDAVSESRVRRHRSLRRGKGFATVEQSVRLENLSLSGRPVVLLECLSNLLANEMFSSDGRKTELFPVILDGIRHLRRQSAHLVIVSNQIFSDGGAYDRLTLKYMEELGRLNRAVAAEADRAWEVVCGIPVLMKGADE